MTNRDLAGSLMRQAESRKAALRVAVEDENWAYVVRLSQEVVELSLKAILNFAGVEPPKWHDVGTLVKIAIVSRHPSRCASMSWPGSPPRSAGIEKEACTVMKWWDEVPTSSTDARMPSRRVVGPKKSSAFAVDN